MARRANDAMATTEPCATPAAAFTEGRKIVDNRIVGPKIGSVKARCQNRTSVGDSFKKRGPAKTAQSGIPFNRGFRPKAKCILDRLPLKEPRHSGRDFCSLHWAHQKRVSANRTTASRRSLRNPIRWFDQAATILVASSDSGQTPVRLNCPLSAHRRR